MEVRVTDTEVVLYARPQELDGPEGCWSECYTNTLRISFSLQEKEMHMEVYDPATNSYSCRFVQHQDCPSIPHFITLVSRARGSRVEALKAIALALAPEE